jgi:hypothetical protein
MRRYFDDDVEFIGEVTTGVHSIQNHGSDLCAAVDGRKDCLYYNKAERLTATTVPAARVRADGRDGFGPQWISDAILTFFLPKQE